MTQREPPSQLDQGETNWQPSKQTFEDWAREGKHRHLTHDKRSTEVLRERFYQDRTLLEPEFP